MTLKREPNLANADAFYEALINSQRELSDDQADMLLAKLVLILANHIGDRAVLDEALALARNNTLQSTLVQA
ncbi:DUF2783 domain-containing protein [Roseateles toxinivorans]|uniref:Uncharacterized protein DUF2783 n=1 Tax=Roseateles toxinivorans TaxID=270368 RepID=A0A4R6QKR2_9BURK|nr:DUF2783 domain-containing protein [Roseateles toxinivorans]TDP63232.1 uncharacterized protein DUF2783 [Roseateles toxinivorans]